MPNVTVDSFFRNEDRALDALGKIKKIGGTSCLIERIDREDDKDMIPLIFYGGATSQVMYANTSAFPNAPVWGLLDDNDQDKEQAMLSFSIPEDKVDESIDIITSSGGWLQ